MRVSIVVPARNEEATIVPALESLVALSYSDFEIVVVNDRSTDATEERVTGFMSRYQGAVPVRLLHSPGDPPPGWVGKTFATDFALKQSTGEIILVCDADVRHSPESLERAVRAIEEQRLDLLSQLPHFILRSWGEYPLLFQSYLLYSASRMSQMLGSRQSFIMGTYLMFTRTFYERSGGWERHRAYPESLPLLNYCIQHGGRFLFLPDRNTVRTHMYEGASGTFFGLVRNSNFALLQPLPLALFAGHLSLFSTALYYAFQGQLFGALAVALMSGFFAVYLLRSGYTPRTTLAALAVSVVMPFYLCAVAAVALLRRLFRTPTPWRGRYIPQ